MESKQEVAQRGWNTLNEGAGDHVNQPLTCDRVQEWWSASLKQEHCSQASWFFGSGDCCHGSQTANNHSEHNSGIAYIILSLLTKGPY